MKNILCFGDSNTYGYKPDGTGRFDETIRWTALLQQKFGEEAKIIEEGLCGRTTVFQDEFREGRRGVDLIGTIVESHNPVDTLVIMLGTNDCKTRYGASAGIIAKGLQQVIEKAKKFASRELKILVVSPILLAEGVGEAGFDPEFDSNHSEKVSLKLAEEYKKVAKAGGYLFLNAAEYATPSKTDREHLDEVGHANLAEAIYQALA